MTVLHYHVGLTLLLQVVTTATLLGLYAATTSLREQESDHASDRNMVLFAAFLFDYHPTVKDLNALLGRPKDQAIERGEDLFYFAYHLANYIKDGTLPLFALAAKVNLGEQLVSLALAPVFPIFGVYYLFGYGRKNLARIAHTEYRKNTFSIFMMFLAFDVLIAVATAELLLRRTPHFGAVLIVVSLVGIVASLVGLSLVALQQKSWKGYWSYRLLEIMAVAEHEKKHDLFNRAMILNSYVDSQPDIPIPGRLGFYTAVYSAVQVVILFAAKSLHFS